MTDQKDILVIGDSIKHSKAAILAAALNAGLEVIFADFTPITDTNPERDILPVTPYILQAPPYFETDYMSPIGKTRSRRQYSANTQKCTKAKRRAQKQARRKQRKQNT